MERSRGRGSWGAGRGAVDPQWGSLTSPDSPPQQGFLEKELEGPTKHPQASRLQARALTVTLRRGLGGGQRMVEAGAWGFRAGGDPLPPPQGFVHRHVTGGESALTWLPSLRLWAASSPRGQPCDSCQARCRNLFLELCKSGGDSHLPRGGTIPAVPPLSLGG